MEIMDATIFLLFFPFNSDSRVKVVKEERLYIFG